MRPTFGATAFGAAGLLLCLLASARETCCGEALAARAGVVPAKAHTGPSHTGDSRTAGGSAAASQLIGKALDGEELVALAGDRLLLWSAQGRARWRSATGQWSELTLPLVRVRQVRAKGKDFLLVGQDAATRGLAASWMTVEGKELGRWALPQEAGSGTAIDAAGMQITLPSGVVGLLPDGALAPVRALPEDGHRSQFGGLRWVELAGSSIVCHGADLSMASNAPGHCRRLGVGGWEFEGPFAQPPLECGSWLIVSNSADGKALQVRDASSGQPQGATKLSQLPLLECAGPNELLVGTKELAIRRLPSLEVAWRHPVGKSPVQQLAVLESFIAYQVSGSLDVRRVAKPTSGKP